MSIFRMFAVGVLLLLVGCGSGGSDGDDAAFDENLSSNEGTGVVSIVLTKGADTEENSTASNVIQALSLPEPTKVRVVIRHTEAGFKAIKDITVPATEVINIPVPAREGYTVDGLSYEETGYNNREKILLKHGQLTGVNVIADETTNISLTLEHLTTTITPPTEVTGGDQYTASITRDFPFRSYAYLDSYLEPYTDENVTTDNGSSSGFTLNAPSVDADGYLYFQTKLYIDDALLGSDESFPYWYYVYPNITQGEDQVSCPIYLPEGGIGIGITY